MNIPFYQEQADLLFRIASWRSEWLDEFFLFLNYFDTPYFFMILIPFVWVGFSYRWGIRLAFMLILNGLITFCLKTLFELPRPFVDFPMLEMLPLHSYGLPSGGAQQAALLGGMLIIAWKDYWAWAIAIAFAFLIGFSRLYLGVHYPMDVLTGWIVGALLAIAFAKGIDPLEHILKKQGRVLGPIVCAIISFFYLYFVSIPSIASFMGALLGFSFGAYLSIQNDLYYTSPRSIKSGIYRGCLAVFSLWIVYLLIHQTGTAFVRSFTGALWISLGATPFCRNFLPEKLNRPSKRTSKKRFGL